MYDGFEAVVLKIHKRELHRGLHAQEMEMRGPEGDRLSPGFIWRMAPNDLVRVVRFSGESK
jgi:hypothetical protein